MSKAKKSKTYEKIMGYEKAQEIKKLRSDSRKGKHLSLETKYLISNSNKGKTKGKKKVHTQKYKDKNHWNNLENLNLF